MLFILFSSIAAMALAEDMKNLRFLAKDNGEISIRNLAGGMSDIEVKQAAFALNEAKKRLNPKFILFVMKTLKYSPAATSAAIITLASFNPDHDPNSPKDPEAAIKALSDLLIFCPSFIKAFRDEVLSDAAYELIAFLHPSNITEAAKIIQGLPVDDDKAINDIIIEANNDVVIINDYLRDVEPESHAPKLLVAAAISAEAIGASIQLSKQLSTEIAITQALSGIPAGAITAADYISNYPIHYPFSDLDEQRTAPFKTLITAITNNV